MRAVLIFGSWNEKRIKMNDVLMTLNKESEKKGILVFHKRFKKVTFKKLHQLFIPKITQHDHS